MNNAEQGGGVMPLKEATWESVNVVFAQLGLDVGPENIARTAYQMGITSPLGVKGAHAIPCKLGPNCYIPPADAIGGLSVGVTPLEQANAYATLAAGGVHHDPTAIDKIVFPGGKVDEPGAGEGKRVLTAGQAYEVTKILEGVITGGTGAGYTYMGCSSEAGKTGTSEDLSDAWFVGYTPKYSTAVWTGHPLSRDSTGYGGPTSGPIWRSYMEAAQGSDCPDFEVPSSLPTLSSFHGEHTSSSSSSCSSSSSTDSSSYSCGSSSTYEQTTTSDSGSGNGRDKGAYAPGVGQKPAPSPKPKPTPAPAPAPAPVVPDPPRRAAGSPPRAEPLALPLMPAGEFDLIAAINQRLPRPDRGSGCRAATTRPWSSRAPRARSRWTRSSTACTSGSPTSAAGPSGARRWRRPSRTWPRWGPPRARPTWSSARRRAWPTRSCSRSPTGSPRSPPGRRSRSPAAIWCAPRC